MQNDDEDAMGWLGRHWSFQLLLWLLVILGAVLAFVTIAIVFHDAFGIRMET